jgi:N-acetylglutamate synthase
MPPVNETRIGRWRLRAADGFTGRANSALAVGDPGMPLGEALREVCEFARRHGIPPMIQAIEGSPVTGAIAAAGWVRHEYNGGQPVSVQTGPLGAGATAVSMLAVPSPGWWQLTVGGDQPTAVQRHVLTTGEIAFGVAEVGDLTAGAVRAALAGDLLHIARLAVHPEHRRRGLAKALMAASGQWAAERGAVACVLQVSVDNASALALYRELGFRERHRYGYWAPAPILARSCEDRSL